MAKLSAHGTVVMEAEIGDTPYRVMSDGVILRSWRYEGRLQGWTIARRCGTADAARGVVEAWQRRQHGARGLA